MNSITSVTPVTKYLTIFPGQTGVLKKSVNILSIMNNGSVNYTTTCGTLPTAQDIKCYSLSWAVTNNGDSSSQAWDNHTSIQKISSVVISGVTFPIEASIYDSGTIVTKLIAIPSINNVLFSITPFSNSSADLYSVGFTFKTIKTIASDFYLATTEVTGISSIRIYPVEVTC